MLALQWRIGVNRLLLTKTPKKYHLTLNNHVRLHQTLHQMFKKVIFLIPWPFLYWSWVINSRYVQNQVHHPSLMVQLNQLVQLQISVVPG